jgi:hypothetical protein
VTRNSARTRADDFLDPDDRTLFPRLDDIQTGELAAAAESVSLAAGEILFEQGQHDTPFYVVRSGAIDIFDRRPEGVRYFTQCRAGTFIGDIAVLTGEPTIAAGAAAEPTALLISGGLAGLGGTTGAVISGVLTDLASWRWIFYINIPVFTPVLRRATDPTRSSRQRPGR